MLFFKYFFVSDVPFDVSDPDLTEGNEMLDCVIIIMESLCVSYTTYTITITQRCAGILLDLDSVKSDGSMAPCIKRHRWQLSTKALINAVSIILPPSYAHARYFSLCINSQVNSNH